MKSLKNSSLAGVLVVAMAGCGPAPRDPVVIDPVRPVHTLTIETSNQIRERSFSGISSAEENTELSFRLGGTIQQLNVEKGQRVTKDQVLAELDQTDYQVQLKQRKAELVRAEANRKEARSEYQRSENLFESDSISRSEFDSAEGAWKRAEADYDAAEQALNQAEQNIGYTQLKAPVDGVIEDVMVNVYQGIGAGQAVAHLFSGQGLEVEIGIPESLVSVIDQEVTAKVEFESLPGRQFSAKVSEVGVNVTQSGTYPITLALEGSAKGLRPGMTAIVRMDFELDAKQIGVFLPLYSVITRSNGEHFVWIYNSEKGVVERRMVEVGELTEWGLEIKSGVSPGEMVIEKGGNLLEDQMAVRPL